MMHTLLKVHALIVIMHAAGSSEEEEGLFHNDSLSTAAAQVEFATSQEQTIVSTTVRHNLSAEIEESGT